MSSASQAAIHEEWTSCDVRVPPFWFNCNSRSVLGRVIDRARNGGTCVSERPEGRPDAHRGRRIPGACRE